MRLAIFAAALMISAAPAHAEFQEISPLMPQGVPTVQVPSAEAMLSFCNNEIPGDIELCSGYIRGIAEFHNFLWMGQTGPIFCLPDQWGSSIMRPVVVSYLSSNIENWKGRPAFGAVLAALADAFPCP